jgi:L-lactate dehydrogenase complex protein LldF
MDPEQAGQRSWLVVSGRSAQATAPSNWRQRWSAALRLRLAKMAELPLSHKDSNGVGWIDWLPGMLGGWTQVRDLREMPKQTFRQWFEEREKAGKKGPANGN